jgi:hypothetical protein
MGNSEGFDIVISKVGKVSKGVKSMRQEQAANFFYDTLRDLNLTVDWEARNILKPSEAMMNFAILLLLRSPEVKET